MKKILSIFLVTSLITLVFSSCYSYSYISEKKMRAVSLGMNKEQITAVLGADYQVIELSKNEAGTLDEVLGYKTSDIELYKLYLKNDKLIKIEKEWIRRNNYLEPNSSSAPTTSTKKVDNSSTKAHLDAHRNAMLSTASTDSEKATINTHMDAHSRAVLGE